MKKEKKKKPLIWFLVMSGTLTGCATKELTVKSTPADAVVYIKGFDRDYFPEEKIKIGQTPLRADHFSFTDADGKRHKVTFNDVDKTPFYVIVEKQNYETVALDAPPLAQDVKLQASPGAEVTTRLYDSIKRNDTGTVRVSSNPPGAKVYLNGDFVGNTPYDVTQKAGKYALELKLPNYPDVNENVVIVPQQARILNFDLAENKRAVAAVAEEPARVELTSTPSGAQVYVDGILVGNTPFNLEKAPGTYGIVVKYPEFKQANESVTVEKGKSNKIHIKLEKNDNVAVEQQPETDEE